MEWIEYSTVRDLLESNGWTLQRTWPPFHCWTKGENLPILVEITDKKVRATDVQRIREAIERSKRRQGPREGD